MIRILHLSDSHLGAQLPVRPRRDLPRRGEDLIASFQRVAAAALRGSADLVLHTGDLFHSSKPSGGALMEASRSLLEIAGTGIPVVLLGGRYDGGIYQIPLLLAHRNIHWIARPRTVQIDCRGIRVTVAAVPHVKDATPERFTEALRATGDGTAAGDIRILALHQVFESAVRGPLGRRYAVGDEVMSRDRLPGGFHYVAVGGVHRHQRLEGPGDAPVVYAGSTDRISFDERNEPKGCVLAEWIDGRMMPRFIEHPVRPVAVLPLDVSGWTRGRIIDRAMESVASLSPDTFVELRLTGRNTRTALSAMDLPGRAREIRPDVLLQVAFQSVEMRAQRRPATARTSAFACLGASPEPLVQVSATDAKLLPRRPGAYCLYDATGRPLYVGKARDLRTRVRCHLRPAATAGYFSGWTGRIARIEARPTCSELEALLVEAELVRRLRPPFNQQMRLWSRYCYIAPDDESGRLVIHRRRPKTSPCFGPYRSVGHARRILEAIELARSASDGVCPQASGTENLPLAWQAALSGIDDAAVRTLETRAEALAAESEATGGASADPTPGLRSGLVRAGNVPEEIARQAALLRGVFEQAALLREAESLIGDLLVMPGKEETRRLVLITPRGLLFDVLKKDPADAARVMRRHRQITRNGRTAPGRLRRSTADALRLIARHLRRGNAECVLIPATTVKELSAEGLLSMAYAET